MVERFEETLRADIARNNEEKIHELHVEYFNKSMKKVLLVSMVAVPLFFAGVYNIKSRILEYQRGVLERRVSRTQNLLDFVVQDNGFLNKKVESLKVESKANYHKGYNKAIDKSQEEVDKFFKRFFEKERGLREAEVNDYPDLI